MSFLKEQGTLDNFTAILTRDLAILTFIAHNVSSEKGSSLKGKKLLLKGANSFLLELTPFRSEAKQFGQNHRPWECILSP